MAFIFNRAGQVINSNFKTRRLSDKKLISYLKDSNFRLISNERDLITIKKGYGVGFTVTFNSNSRITEMRPRSGIKKMTKIDGDVVIEITKLLAR